jgi:hypothetical protein
MSNCLGRQALVIGAGMGGLAATGALAKHFEQVTVLERDILPHGPAHRSGTPQSRQLHGLLSGGLEALCRIFPGIDRDLAAAGAALIRVAADIWEELPGFDPFPRRDFGALAYAASRPLLEHTLRRRARALRNVVIRDGWRVLELVLSNDGRSVAGARCQQTDGTRETLSADLVVDASARGILTLATLDALGCGRPVSDHRRRGHRLRHGRLRDPEGAPRLAGRAHLPARPERRSLLPSGAGRGRPLDGLHRAAALSETAARPRRVHGGGAAAADAHHP